MRIRSQVSYLRGESFCEVVLLGLDAAEDWRLLIVVWLLQVLELTLRFPCAAEASITDAGSASFKALHRVALMNGEFAQAVRRLQQPIL